MMRCTLPGACSSAVQTVSWCLQFDCPTSSSTWASRQVKRRSRPSLGVRIVGALTLNRKLHYYLTKTVTVMLQWMGRIWTIRFSRLLVNYGRCSLLVMLQRRLYDPLIFVGNFRLWLKRCTVLMTQIVTVLMVKQTDVIHKHTSCGLGEVLLLKK